MTKRELLYVLRFVADDAPVVMSDGLPTYAYRADDGSVIITDVNPDASDEDNDTADCA